jgi:hypothetical protein
MSRIIVAVAAAFALVSAAPALACPDCKDCPNHKDKVAAADKAAKKDAPAPAKKCACGATDHKDCKCGDKCDCHAKKETPKDAKKS